MCASSPCLPALPSWRRYRKLFPWSSRHSLLRALEYELLSELTYKGKVLDFGGGEKTKYRERLRQWARNCTYESVNINPKTEPTHLVVPGDKLPLDDGSYDMVITFNTLEHIYDVQESLREIYRVLKSGGQFIAIVPFLFPIHGHPDDFFRGTPSWWRVALSSIGFCSIDIRPLLWGPMSAGLSMMGIPGPFKKIRLHIALIFDLFYATVCRSKKRWETIGKAPLGFIITAKRAPTATS